MYSNTMCRLCLNNSKFSVMFKLNECDILQKLSTALSIQLNLDVVTLPNQVCEKCVDKINEINIFRETILNNEEKLLCQYKDQISLTLKAESIKTEFAECSADNEKQLHIDIVEDKSLNNEIELNTIKEENLHDNVYENYSLNGLETVGILKISEQANQITHNLQTHRLDPLCAAKETIDNTKGNIAKLIPKTNFNCLMCSELCDNRGDLVMHYKKKHTQMITNKMDIKETYKLLVKCNDGANGMNYQCVKCNKMYKKKYDIKRHLSTHISNERPYICNICGRTYKTISEIILHNRVHNMTEKMLCIYGCGFSTVYLSAMRDHEKRHKKEFKYTCDKCGKGFFVKTWFEQHQNFHTGMKPYVCDICGEAFHMDSTISTGAEQSISQGPVRLGQSQQVQNKVFPKANYAWDNLNRYLKTHRTFKHPQSLVEKRYVCPHCALPCHARNALTQHLKVHGETAMTFLCDTCGKVFKTKFLLNIHEKSVHLNIKPYACSTCNKRFVKKHNMRVHERAHANLRPHACARCGRAYAQRSTLLRHQASKHKNIASMKSEAMD